MEIHRIRDNCLNAFMGNRSRQGVRGESEIEVAELPWPNEPSQLRLQRHQSWPCQTTRWSSTFVSCTATTPKNSNRLMSDCRHVSAHWRNFFMRNHSLICRCARRRPGQARKDIAIFPPTRTPACREAVRKQGTNCIEWLHVFQLDHIIRLLFMCL